MKFAVAFFGIPRSSSICFPTIQTNIFDILPAGTEVTYHYHLYRQTGVINPRSNEAGILTAADYAPFVDNMNGILEPPGECLDKWDYPALKKYGDAWGDDFCSLRNLVHQLHSIHQVTMQLELFGPDLVIYVRPDLYYHSPLPRYALSHTRDWQRTVYVPSWQWWNGLNDRFAVCGTHAFRAYGLRIRDALEFCAQGNKLHGEQLLRYSLHKNHLKIRTLGTKATRVRTGGRFQDERFSIMRSTGTELSVQILNRACRVGTMWDRFAARRLVDAE